jgi:hypothetical protein
MAFALSVALAMPTDGVWGSPDEPCNPSFEIHGRRLVEAEAYCDLDPVFRRDSLFVVRTKCHRLAGKYDYPPGYGFEVWEIENKNSVLITGPDFRKTTRYVRCMHSPERQ